MRLARSWIIALGLAGCGGSTATPDAGAPDAIVDAPPPPPWWEPRPGDARDWDVQLHAPFDTSAPRTMYLLDLWAVVPSPTTLDYGDGDPVAVPAGALAGTIATLHARTPPAIVVCRVDTGAVELDAPDARKFPGYEANPPDNPNPPKPGSVIGWSVDSPAERYLDLRAASRDLWNQLVYKRLDLAKQIGCDAVAGDRNDTIPSVAGFDVTLPDLNGWYRDVAAQTHARTMSAGMKDGAELPNQSDDLAPVYDWQLVQRCAEYQDCDTSRPFINLHKAVFAIDYQLDQTDGSGVDPTIGCTRQITAMVADGLVKDVALSSAYRYQCVP